MQSASAKKNIYKCTYFILTYVYVYSIIKSSKKERRKQVLDLIDKAVDNLIKLLTIAALIIEIWKSLKDKND